MGELNNLNFFGNRRIHSALKTWPSFFVFKFNTFEYHSLK